MHRTDWNGVCEKFIDEHTHLFTCDNKKERLKGSYKRLLELIDADDWDREQRMLLAYELRYELELNGLNKLHMLPTDYGIALNYYKSPNKFENFEDLFKRMKEIMIERQGEEYAEEYVNVHKNPIWKVLSIEHGLFSCHLDGEFQWFVQIGNNEEIYTYESIYKRIERDECPLVITGWRI